MTSSLLGKFVLPLGLEILCFTCQLLSDNVGKRY
jgi:hypothetical protein